MNDEQLDLARRLASHPRFEWREGMAAREVPLIGNWQPGDYGWRILSGAPDVAAVTTEGDMHEVPYMPSAFAMAVPDLTDAATGGVLLDMLSKLPGMEQMVAIPRGDHWTIENADVDEPGDVTIRFGTTLAEACARALLAEWEATLATPETTAS